MSEWITLKEVCELLGLAPNTVYKLIEAGQLPAYEVKGVRGMKFKREEIEALITPVEVKTKKKK